MGIFNRKLHIGWHADDNPGIVRYFDGSSWRGEAHLTALDDLGPLTPGASFVLQEEADGLRQQIFELETSKASLLTDASNARKELEALNAELEAVENDVYLNEVKFSDNYPTAADGSDDVMAEIKELRAEMKQILKDGTALQIDGQLAQHFDDNSGLSEEQLKKLRKDFSELFLGTFNVECEAAVRQLRTTSNLESSSARVRKAYTATVDAGRGIGVGITGEYFLLRHKELILVFHHLAAKAQERADARAEKERIREESQAQEEFRRAITGLEKELEHYEQMLAQMRSMHDAEGAARYEALVDDTKERIADIEDRAANTRVGYVYVISNIGSFGEDVVEIGLTRRLEPLNRVRELSNASVPFKYDVHAMVFSLDAVSLETALHQHFDEQRINTVNRRREFFRVTPRHVLEALKQHDADLVEWVEDPIAEEYRLTMSDALGL